MLSDASQLHPLLGDAIYGPLLPVVFTFTETALTMMVGVGHVSVSITSAEYASLRMLANDDWRSAHRIFVAARARGATTTATPKGH